jgi:hypothetical protein
MLRRLLLGLILGLVVGGLAAAALVAGLHVALFPAGAGGAALAYLTAGATGVLTGLVAGKPIWASGAKIEAGLKAFFGALIAAGLMFVLRHWVPSLPVPALLAPGETLDAVRQAGLGDFPAVALPLVAAVLGGFFELDNTGTKSGEDDKPGAAGAKKRVADAKTNGQSKARVASDDDAEDDEAAAAAPKRAKR